MSSNRAAWQPAKLATSLEVSDAPFPKATEGKIVIRNAAVAINPFDWIMQSSGDMIYGHLRYPFVLGFDLAGEVVDVGKGVTRFHKGDHIVAFSRAPDKNVNEPAEGAFQQYVVVREGLASPIPISMPYENASVLGLGLMTATAALFDESQLGLKWPTAPARQSAKKTVIIWGGSTSVGCNAIQLAVAAGYEVFTTASPKNFDLVRRLGAAHVWDYRSASVVDDMVAAAARGKTLAGAVSIGNGAVDKCIDVLSRCSSNANKFVAMVTFPVNQERAKSFPMLHMMVSFASGMASVKLRSTRKGVKTALVAVDPIYKNGLSKHIFAEFLPKALQDGSFVPAPEPEVVGHGLEHIQKALEILKKGVSAKKLVVTL